MIVQNRFTKDVPSEKEVRRITPGDSLIDMEIFPDYPQFVTTILALDNDDIFQAHAEYRRQTRPTSTSPKLRDSLVKVRHLYPSLALLHYLIII